MQPSEKRVFFGDSPSCIDQRYKIFYTRFHDEILPNFLKFETFSLVVLHNSLSTANRLKSQLASRKGLVSIASGVDPGHEKNVTTTGRYPPICARQSPGTNPSRQGPPKTATSQAP